MIKCKNKVCMREFEVHRNYLYDIIQIEKFSKELHENIISYNIEVQCPFCKAIFAIPIEDYFKIKYEDDLKRIEKIRSEEIREVGPF